VSSGNSPPDLRSIHNAIDVPAAHPRVLESLFFILYYLNTSRWTSVTPSLSGPASASGMKDIIFPVDGSSRFVVSFRQFDRLTWKK